MSFNQRWEIVEGRLEFGKLSFNIPAGPGTAVGAQSIYLELRQKIVNSDGSNLSEINATYEKRQKRQADDSAAAPPPDTPAPPPAEEPVITGYSGDIVGPENNFLMTQWRGVRVKSGGKVIFTEHTHVPLVNYIK